jgi:hypothetical protein
MANTDRNLSDAALAVFAFAAYHELESGQVVKSVIRSDNAGHKADEAAISELKEHGFVEADEAQIRFTKEGERIKQAVIDGLRSAANSDRLT